MTPGADLQLQHLERFSAQEQENIAKALLFSRQHHAPQKRISGEPYIVHPFSVAQILVDEFHADADAVIAGLLHDTVEDTDATLDDVEREFGSPVRFLVDGATNVGEGDGVAKIHDWYVRTAKSHEKVRKMAERDPRLLLVKFADRWHNLTTCASMRPFNQVRMAEDALLFHVPLCREHGFPKQADKMQALCDAILGRHRV